MRNIQSTLLKSMAGILKHDAGHTHTGTVTYNGSTTDSKSFALPKVAHFAEQVGIGPHFFFV